MSTCACGKELTPEQIKEVDDIFNKEVLMEAAKEANKMQRHTYEQAIRKEFAEELQKEIDKYKCGEHKRLKLLIVSLVGKEKV